MGCYHPNSRGRVSIADWTGELTQASMGMCMHLLSVPALFIFLGMPIEWFCGIILSTRRVAMADSNPWSMLAIWRRYDCNALLYPTLCKVDQSSSRLLIFSELPFTPSTNLCMPSIVFNQKVSRLSEKNVECPWGQFSPWLALNCYFVLFDTTISFDFICVIFYRWFDRGPGG